MELLSHKEFQAELMKDPKFRKAYKDLNFEFTIREALFIASDFIRRLADSFRLDFKATARKF